MTHNGTDSKPNCVCSPRLEVSTAAPLVFRHNGDDFEQHVPLEAPKDPMSGQTFADKPRGLASVLYKNDVNGLI